MDLKLGQLTEEQQEVLDRVEKHFKQARRGYIKVPTGWGKTFLAKHLINNHLRNNECIVFVVSRNNELLSQTFFEDKEKTRPLFKNSVILSSENKDQPSLDQLQEAIDGSLHGYVVFVSLQTLLSRKKLKLLEFLCQKADLVVLDEIHNFIFTKGHREFIERLNSSACVFGMTATPFQGIIGRLKHVQDIPNMQLLFSKSLSQCIVEGQLSELTYHIVESGMDMQDVFFLDAKLEELKRDELFIDCSSEAKLNLITRRTFMAKRVYDELIPEKANKTLVFCSPVANLTLGDDDDKAIAFHAKLAAAIFNGEINQTFTEISLCNWTSDGRAKFAAYLTSDMSDEDKRLILNNFKSPGKPPFVLCTVGMLCEGFDYPDLKNLILLRSTLSPRLYEQQIGRVTRTSKSKNRGNIFEIADDLDSLYSRLGDEIFNGDNMEKLIRLSPDVRMNECLGSDEDSEPDLFRQNLIDVKRVRFIDNISGPIQVLSIELPSLETRQKVLHAALELVNRKKDGKLLRETVAIMRSLVLFRATGFADFEKMFKTLNLLEQLIHTARNEADRGELTTNCAKNKPLLFQKASILLKLRLLTDLQTSPVNQEQKAAILERLGFPPEIERIDEFRHKLLLDGSEHELDGLIKMIDVGISFLEPKGKFSSLLNGKVRLKRWLHKYVFWLYCFKNDHPTLQQWFEDPEWNRIIGIQLFSLK